MISLVKPNFIVGNERAFSDFVSNLGEEKVAIISHNDLDGISAARIAHEAIDADFIRMLNYDDLNLDLVEILKAEKIEKVIFSDLFIKDPDFLKSLEKFADILIIDHHEINQNYNSSKTVFLNAKGFCATYLCYYLFSKVKNLENFDWIVDCACLSDWTFEMPREWLEKVHEKYGDKLQLYNEEGQTYIKFEGKFHELERDLNFAIIYFKETKEFRKIFDSIGDKFGDVGGLLEQIMEVRDYFEYSKELFEEERKEINGRFFWEYDPKFSIGSMLSNYLSKKYPHKTIIVAKEKEGALNFSARRQDGREDMNNLLSSLVEGLDGQAGGHFKASGGSIKIKDREEFMKRLETQ